MKIKINDKVEVIKGKDAGKNGKVIQVFPKAGKVVVEGVHLMKKHMRPNRRGEKGQVIELSTPMFVSNVVLLCPKCGRKTRVGFKKEAGNKERQCKKCKEVIG
jgi:large subunit ribosomal protein L24